MKIENVSTRKLREWLRQAERTQGPNSDAVRLLRRELDNRRRATRQRRGEGASHA